MFCTPQDDNSCKASSTPKRKIIGEEEDQRKNSKLEPSANPSSSLKCEGVGRDEKTDVGDQESPLFGVSFSTDEENGGLKRKADNLEEQTATAENKKAKKDHSCQWVLLPGADADLSGVKLIAGKTLISYESGSVNEEGLFLGMAEKEGNRYLVLGQMILECVTLLVTTGTDKAVTTEDWFGKVYSMNEQLVEIAWENLRVAKDKAGRFDLTSDSEGLAFLHLHTCVYFVCIFHRSLQDNKYNLYFINVHPFCVLITSGVDVDVTADVDKNQARAVISPKMLGDGCKGLKAGAKVHNATHARTKDRLCRQSWMRKR
jgi:hypothetical protein